MILVLTVTIPIFVVILAGYIAARRGIMGRESIKAFTTFVFYICLPLLLFHNLANAPVADQLRGDYVLAYLSAGLLSFAIGYAVARTIFNCTVAEQIVQGLAVSFGHTSILLGGGVAIMGVELPAALTGLVKLVQGATVPCALFAIGASLAGLSFSERLRETGFTAAGKLLLYPFLVFVFMSMFPDIL